MPTAEDSTYFNGAYTASNSEIWLNPATALFTAPATYAIRNAAVDILPNASLPGSIGKAIFYANMEGQW
jgi:hypothetical protein